MGAETDVVIVGARLSGLVAACEIADAGRKVVLLDQEPEASLGGQAFWSLGGLFLVGSPEQCRLGIRDSRELALADWLGTAAFDREEDFWPRQWAEAYIDFAAGEKRSWLRQRGIQGRVIGRLCRGQTRLLRGHVEPRRLRVGVAAEGLGHHRGKVQGGRRQGAIGRSHRQGQSGQQGEQP